MMDEIFYDNLKEKVKEILGVKGIHSFPHVERVYNNSLEISQGEDVDLDVVKTAALLHDIGNKLEDPAKDYGENDHGEIGAKYAKEILEKTDFPKEKIEAVCYCIFVHNKEHKGVKFKTKESKILHEADLLDSAGLSGVIRTFSVYGKSLSFEEIFNKLRDIVRLDKFTFPKAIEIAKRRFKDLDDFEMKFKEDYENKK